MFNLLIKRKIAKSLSNYDKIVVWGSGGLGRLAINNWLPNEKIEYVIDSSIKDTENIFNQYKGCLLYTSPSPRDGLLSRMPSSA